jgi:putative spermidine/putrescine transport system ATP-binding protein
MSDRIAVFNEGKLAQVGTATELYEHPQSLFVANFLGDSNILRGEAHPEQDAHVLVNRCGRFVAPRSDRFGQAAPAAISVRPERMRVMPVSQTCSDANRVVGRVSQIIYVGSSRKVEAALADGTVIQVREQPRDQLDVREGSEVAICWPTSATTLLPLDEVSRV